MEPTPSSLAAAAKKVVDECLGVKPGEVVTILTDSENDERQRIARSFWEAAREKGAEPILVEMLPRETSGEEPPFKIAALMALSDVLLCPTTKSLSHTRARQNASSRHVRVASLPGVTEKMALRCLTADYTEIARRSEAVASVLRSSAKIRITSAKGTDLRVERGDRKAFADTGLLQQPGAIGNLPAGEAFFAPIEGTAEGEIVFDGSIADIGKLSEPVRLTVKNGMAQVTSDNEPAKKLKQQLSAKGPEAYNIAEVGIGTNHQAQLDGVILEDEKVLGTVHIALGNNSVMGGKVSVGIHLDGLIRSATLYVDDRLLLENGILKI
jgi:leucyl aminopeptidase (aminopeptidase T)